MALLRGALRRGLTPASERVYILGGADASTPQRARFRQSGLPRFEDPESVGGAWVPCADTRHLSDQQIAGRQRRLLKITVFQR